MIVISRLLIALVAAIGLGRPAGACSIVTSENVEFQPDLAIPGEKTPPAPQVTVRQIHRGYEGAEPGFDCSDAGVITLSILATEESRELLYQFELIDGVAEDTIFWPPGRMTIRGCRGRVSETVASCLFSPGSMDLIRSKSRSICGFGSRPSAGRGSAAAARISRFTILVVRPPFFR
ncbi:hypothetical protein D3874_24430 [Oleomonas cavernae]|uniref:Uncharacterized protein n=1 Tax=Oleomonas cavernae TaxID=2320859 RepID=A0A418WI49_9PROT|nr:hypothetical protein D3874_24430 [Oleomonas cavernae]